MNDSAEIDLGTGRITSLFRQFFFPTLLGMTFSAVFILTDGVFVGQGIGSAGLASINIIQPIFTICTAIGLMFGSGASVLAAICLSRNEALEARKTVTLAFAAVIVLGGLLASLFYLFPDPILRFLGSSDSLFQMCKDYYLWFVPCALFVMFSMMGQFVIRLDGSPRFSSLVEIVPAIVNIILDWVFIFPCGWGVAGAAAATTVGGIVGVGMVVWYMLRRSSALRLCHGSFARLGEVCRKIAAIAKIGMSSFVGEFAVSVLTLAGNFTFLKVLGEDGLAAYSVICYLVPVVFMIFMAINQSAQPIISYNHGAGAEGRVKSAFRLSLTLSLSFGIVMTLMCCLAPSQIVSVFLDRSSSAFDVSVRGLAMYSLGFVAMSVVQSLISFLQSVERPIPATVLTLMRGMLLPVTALLIFPLIFDASFIWLAIPAAEMLTLLIVSFRSPYHIKRYRKNL